MTELAEKKLNEVHECVMGINSILHGQSERPGLLSQVNKHEALLFGEDGDMGDHHRVSVMWRVHVWILCTISAALGGILTLGARWVVVNFKI